MDRSESAVSKRKREEESGAEASLRTTAQPFIASATFSGARRGYWFGRGRLGQGYYADTPAGRGASDGADAALVSGPGLMQARTPSCRACAPAPARVRCACCWRAPRSAQAAALTHSLSLRRRGCPTRAWTAPNCWSRLSATRAARARCVQRLHRRAKHASRAHSRWRSWTCAQCAAPWWHWSAG